MKSQKLTQKIERKGERKISDEILVQKIKAGNEHAFRLLVEKYKDTLYKVVYPIVRNEKDAEDIVQDSFIRIYYSLSNYQSQGLKTWMIRIATNCAIDLMRKRRRTQTDEFKQENELQNDEDAESKIIELEERKLLRKRINELPPAYQTIIKAYYIEEKSYQEVADELSMEVKTVEMKLYRARKWMRKNWKEEEFR